MLIASENQPSKAPPTAQMGLCTTEQRAEARVTRHKGLRRAVNGLIRERGSLLDAIARHSADDFHVAVLGARLASVEADMCGMTGVQALRRPAAPGELRAQLRDERRRHKVAVLTNYMFPGVICAALPALLLDPSWRLLVEFVQWVLVFQSAASIWVLGVVP